MRFAGAHFVLLASVVCGCSSTPPLPRPTPRTAPAPVGDSDKNPATPVRAEAKSEIARWTVSELPAFVVGDRAGIFDPSRAEPSMLVVEPDGVPFVCAIAGSAGRTLVTRSAAGKVGLWRDGRLAASFVNEELVRNVAREPCSTAVLFESSMQVRFAENDTRALVLLTDRQGCGELKLFELGVSEQDIPRAGSCIRGAEFTTNRARIQVNVGGEQKVSIYDIENRREVVEVPDTPSWSHDGRRFAVAVGTEAARRTTIHDATTGAEIRSLPKFVGRSFSPSGRLLFGGVGPPGKVGVMDVVTGTVRTSWKISPLGCGVENGWGSGDSLVYAEGVTLTFWSPGRPPTFRQHDCGKGVPVAKLSKDAKRVLSFDGVFELTSGKRLVTLRAPGDSFIAHSWSHDDTLIAGWDEGGDIVWSFATGEIVSTLPRANKEGLSTARWANERPTLWLRPSDDASPWIGLHDPKLRRTARVAVALENGEVSMLVTENADCFEGSTGAATALGPDVLRRRRCQGLLLPYRSP